MENIEKKEYIENIKPFIEEKEKLKERKKLDKKETKELKESIIDLSETVKEEQLIDLDFKGNISFLAPALKEIFIKLNQLDELKNVSRCYEKLLKCDTKKMAKKELFKLALNHTETNRKLGTIKNNILRNSRKKNNINYVKKDSVTKKYFMQNHIMNVLERELKYAGKRTKVSKKILNIILKECKYSDIAPQKKDKYKKLLEHLNLYYTVTIDAENYIFIGNKKDNYTPKNFR